MIDKPLYQNPLGGGQQGPLDLSKMNKNPYNSEFIGIGKDQTNLFGYKVPDYVIKEQEEYRKKNPINMFNMTPPNELSGLLLSDPQGSDQLNADQEFLKTADEYQRGFRESEFYKPGGAMTADVAEFIYSSPTRGDITMKGSSSGIGQFGAYLDSIGKGDLLQRAGGSFSQDLLGTVNPNDPSQQLLDGTPSLFPIKNERGEDIGGIENTAIASLPQPTEGVSQDIFGNPNYLERSVQPIVSGPETFETATVTGANLPDLPPMFATPGLPPQQEETPGARDLIKTIGTVKGPEDTLLGVANNPYNRVGQQLTGPNQDDILGTLKNIEQGIASLGQGGMNKSSFGGFNNNFGIGSFFPPYGGMYG